MDYYAILGVQPSATDVEIKKAYRELSFKYHPDKSVNASLTEKTENERKFKDVGEAYETLKDPQLRRQYDNRNVNPLQNIFGEIFKQHGSFRNPQQHHPMMNIFDIINEMNVQHHSEPFVFTTVYEHPPTQPCPIEMKIELTLEQAYTGIQLPIMIEREIRNGPSIHRESERIYITIPQGIDSGEIITISEKGCVNNGIKGDIKVQVVLKPHQAFERQGLNIIHRHTITFKESIVGFDFVLNHLDGTSFKLRSSRGNVIQNLDEKIIKGKGVSRDGGVGDLIIVFKVSSPKELTEEQLSALETVL